VTTRTRLACTVVLLVSAVLGAQQEPGPRPGGAPFDRDGPPPANDAAYLRAQVMRALDAKADLLVAQGKPDLAISELRRVLAFEIPKTHPAFELKARLVGRLASLYAANGKKAEALETIKALLAGVAAGTPAEAGAWLDAGTVYRALDMPDEALKAYDRAIELSTTLARTGWRPPQEQPGRHPPGGLPGGRPDQHRP
jgi:tetratricopeptide (TPR) repeat protein